MPRVPLDALAAIPLLPMKIAFLARGCALALLAAPLLFSAPIDDVKAILQDFLDQPNYTWGADWSRGMPEQGGGTMGQEIAGQHEKGGYTKMEFVVGPHIPSGTYPGKTWTGIVDKSDYWSGRWVFETPHGWKKLTSLPLPVGASGPPSRTRPGSIGIQKTITAPLFSVRAFGAWRPDQEVSILLESLAGVERKTDGSYEIVLTPEGAIKLGWVPKMPPVPLFSRLENASGGVKLQAREGSLVRYELDVEGTLTMPVMGTSRAFTTRRVRELKDLGTTVIEIPAEAEKLLTR